MEKNPRPNGQHTGEHSSYLSQNCSVTTMEKSGWLHTTSLTRDQFHDQITSPTTGNSFYK